MLLPSTAVSTSCLSSLANEVTITGPWYNQADGGVVHYIELYYDDVCRTISIKPNPMGPDSLVATWTPRMGAFSQLAEHGDIRVWNASTRPDTGVDKTAEAIQAVYAANMAFLDSSDDPSRYDFLNDHRTTVLGFVDPGHIDPSSVRDMDSWWIEGANILPPPIIPSSHCGLAMPIRRYAGGGRGDEKLPMDAALQVIGGHAKWTNPILTSDTDFDQEFVPDELHAIKPATGDLQPAGKHVTWADPIFTSDTDFDQESVPDESHAMTLSTDTNLRPTRKHIMWGLRISSGGTDSKQEAVFNERHLMKSQGLGHSVTQTQSSSFSHEQYNVTRGNAELDAGGIPRMVASLMSLLVPCC